MANIEKIIVGKTGSGKSFALTKEAFEKLKTHSVVVVLDTEGAVENSLKELIVNHSITIYPSGEELKYEDLKRKPFQLFTAQNKEQLKVIVDSNEELIGEAALLIDTPESDKEINALTSKFKDVTLTLQLQSGVDPENFDFVYVLKEKGFDIENQKTLQVTTL